MGEGRSHFSYQLSVISYQYLLLASAASQTETRRYGYPLVELKLVVQPRGGYSPKFFSQEVGTLHKGVRTETGRVRNDKEAVGYFIP